MGWEVTANVRDTNKADELNAVAGVHIQTQDMDQRASLDALVHVLHAFRKTTQQTEKRDIDLATARLRELMRGRI